VGNWVNWFLLIGGAVFIIVELSLGAFTGFDLALIGASLLTGGALGLVFSSAHVGLIAAAALAFIYLAFLRRWMRKRLTVKDHASNVDAVVGKIGVVTVRIAAHEPGQIKVGDEVWRAELARADEAARNPGEKVTVESVEGVTLKVR
jgi:membrane protein implicated in regulation of membrane protease activity